MIFCDSHVHLVHCPPLAADSFFSQNKYRACAAFVFKDELESWQPNPAVLSSFGIHPQVFASAAPYDALSELDFLEQLLASDSIDAVGECGFDLFTPAFKATLEEQKKWWNLQLELAVAYKKPVIVHCRKAMEHIFSSKQLLRGLPAVVFHSFPGTLSEALSILRKDVHAFFSFGKPLLNGRKASLQCVSSLPLDSLLLETDAPYQTLKGESATFPSEIERVYKAASALRKIPLESLCEILADNFENAFKQS